MSAYSLIDSSQAFAFVATLGYPLGMHLRTILGFALLATACGSAPATPAAPKPPGTEDAKAPAGAGLDLSSEDAARATILDVLKRDDKAAFKACVSQRILAKQEAHFDEWYAVWKGAAEKTPDAFKKITLAKEDGKYKLDEN